MHLHPFIPSARVRFWRACALAALLTGTGLAAQAAVYKCGNVIQDRPCDDSAPILSDKPPAAGGSPRVGSGKPAGGPAAAGPAVAPSDERKCVQRGEYAERVAWKREGGAMQDRQIAEIEGGTGSIEGAAKAAVVRKVYGSRGSAAEHRAAVQEECMRKAGTTAHQRYDEQGCKMLRDQQQQLQIRSQSAQNESQRALYRQVRAELDEKMLMGGCGGR